MEPLRWSLLLSIIQASHPHQALKDKSHMDDNSSQGTKTSEESPVDEIILLALFSAVVREVYDYSS
jgi:hypothetical protein